MYCSRCGGVLQQQSQFCPHCGARVASPATGGWDQAPPVLPLPAPQPGPPPSFVPAPPTRHRAAWLALVAALVLVIGGGTVGIIALSHRANSPAASPVATQATTSSSPTTVASSPTGVASGRPVVSPIVKTVTVAPKPAPTAPTRAVPVAPARPSRNSTTAAPAAPVVDFAAIYKKQQSGVVRIETVGCSDSGVGTGFLLSPTLVATVDHVVTDSAVVSLVTGSGRTTGVVIGSDPVHDLALVRADAPLAGYQFHFSATAPSVGDSVAAIGFPIGDPMTMTRGGISGLDRDITVDGTQRTGLLETDTPVNPGNSGGPLLATDGSVVGLVDALNTQANGIAYAVPAEQAGTADARWAASPVEQPPASCDDPLGPSQERSDIGAPPPGSVTGGQLAGIVATFNTYFGGINAGDYRSAYTALAPGRQNPDDYAGFADGVSTSYDSDIRIVDAQAVDAVTVNVLLTFNSLQISAKGPDGDTCDNWTLVFKMVQLDDGSWRMDGAKPYNGSTHTAC